MLKSFLRGLFARAMEHNKRNILNFACELPAKDFLDLGCDDGAWTIEVARAARADCTSGVELISERAQLASAKNIIVTIADLAEKIPLESQSYDVIHSNQVIEHVADVDLFTSEIFRLLKPGGRAIISTENASSWHNIFALVLGWQMFSLTNMSHLKAGIGNPLALMRNDPITYKTWTHKVIFSYRGLEEFLSAHGFVDIQIKGAGYYPLPTRFGALDPRHSHFLTVSAKRPV